MAARANHRPRRRHPQHHLSSHQRKMVPGLLTKIQKVSRSKTSHILKRKIVGIANVSHRIRQVLVLVATLGNCLILGPSLNPLNPLNPASWLVKALGTMVLLTELATRYAILPKISKIVPLFAQKRLKVMAKLCLEKPVGGLPVKSCPKTLVS